MLPSDWSGRAEYRRGATALDERGLLDACHEGDLDACRELTARFTPAALRAAYLLTGSKTWATQLVCDAMLALLRSVRRGKTIERTEHALLVEIVRRWRAPDASNAAHVRAHSETATDGALPSPPAVQRAQNTLARLDEHQRAAIALHIFGGLPVEPLAEALNLSPELIYVQIMDSRARFIEAAELDGPATLSTALNAVALKAPRLALWPLIESGVQAGFDAERTRQRRLSLGVAGAVCAVLILGVALVAWRDDAPATTATSTPAEVAAAPTTGTVFSIAPTATPTPAANVGDTLVFSHRSSQAQHSWRFDERLEVLPLLGNNTLEAGAPVVAPDGQQVYLLWYAYDAGGATAYVGAFDSDLAQELWRVAVATDEAVAAGERVATRMSVAVDHERVYVARHAWRTQDLVEIDVLSRIDGTLLETIGTNLSGFAAHDVRLHAPPGANQVSLLAITSEAPPETAGLQITFLSYAVPGGAKVHGRILFDLPDSRTFFLYESQLVVGSEMLFGVEHTNYYNRTAVHFFDLGQGRLEPQLVIPFQPVTAPLPYQQAVSHDGHWLYVLSSAGLEVAVFDLLERTLVGIVPLDLGVLSGRHVGVSYPQGRVMQISPDGRRIYAEGTLDGRASGVWVIDADSWTIVEHWLPELQPAEILLSGDGQTLYARTSSGASLPSTASALVAIDTRTGTAQPLAVPEAARFSLESLATLFQRTYASSPSIDGQQQASRVSREPLAAALVDVSQTGAVSGSMVTVAVRFVHPLTGVAVAPETGGARYEPPASVRASWSLDEGRPALILELGRVGYGRYQGVVQLDEPGRWSLEIDIGWPAGGPRERSMMLEEIVRITPLVTADSAPPDGAPAG